MIRIAEIEAISPHRKIYRLNNGLEFRNLKSLGERLSMSQETIYRRIIEYGHDSPAVLYPGPLSQAVFDKLGVVRTFSKSAGKSTKWDRSKCRRNGTRCKSYSDCQSSRLGLCGFPKWIAPRNTDDCFRPEIIRREYRGPLHGYSVGFGR